MAEALTAFLCLIALAFWIKAARRPDHIVTRVEGGREVRYAVFMPWQIDEPVRYRRLD